MGSSQSQLLHLGRLEPPLAKNYLLFIRQGVPFGMKHQCHLLRLALHGRSLWNSSDCGPSRLGLNVAWISAALTRTERPSRSICPRSYFALATLSMWGRYLLNANSRPSLLRSKRRSGRQYQPGTGESENRLRHLIELGRMTEDLRRQRLWLRSCACWPAFGALISAAESWRGLRFTRIRTASCPYRKLKTAD
jgi:hypothetical protein